MTLPLRVPCVVGGFRYFLFMRKENGYTIELVSQQDSVQGRTVGSPLYPFHFYFNPLKS
jgi:hypothetical protein